MGPSQIMRNAAAVGRLSLCQHEFNMWAVMCMALAAAAAAAAAAEAATGVRTLASGYLPSVTVRV